MDIGSVIGNIASGGLVGMVGSLAGAGVEFLNSRQAAKEKKEQSIADYAHEEKVLELTQGRAAQESKENLELAQIKGSFDGLTKSIEDQMALSGRTSQIVTDILAAFRPGLTVLLMILSVVFVLLHTATLADQALQLTGMAVAWWFGDRQRNRSNGLS